MIYFIREEGRKSCPKSQLLTASKNWHKYSETHVIAGSLISGGNYPFFDAWYPVSQGIFSCPKMGSPIWFTYLALEATALSQLTLLISEKPMPRGRRKGVSPSSFGHPWRKFTCRGYELALYSTEALSVITVIILGLRPVYHCNFESFFQLLSEPRK